MNSTIVKIEKSGNRFNAWDQNGVKRTSEILTSTRKSAFNAGMALEQRSGKGGRVYWWKVPMSQFDSAGATLSAPPAAEVNVPTEHAELMNFISTSYSLKPKDLVMNS